MWPSQPAEPGSQDGAQAVLDSWKEALGLASDLTPVQTFKTTLQADLCALLWAPWTSYSLA